MQNKIKVSVITVVFNGERYLEVAIRSVLAQTYPFIEYILIDGASTDATPEIISRYSGHFTHVVSEPDNGMYDAINKGIRLSSGELIGIINSDDWYDPGAVAAAVQALAENPGADVIHGMISRVDRAGRALQVTGRDSSFLDLGMIEHPSCFVTREAYHRYGIFRSDMRAAADYELMLRFRDKGAAFVFLPRVMASFREGGQSASWRAAAETLETQLHYHLISRMKYLLLKLYWRWKTLG